MGRNTQQMADLMPLETNEKIKLSGGDTVHVVRLLGEGGFSYVFLAQNPMNGASDQGHQASISSGASLTDNDSNTSTCNLSDNRSVRSNSEQAANNEVALKVTSIHSREARDVAAKEVSLLKRMRHPNILRLVDVTYVHPKGKKYPLHLIALEYCNGGTALDVVKRLREAKRRFHWQQLIIIFGQIANAVTYLHAQKPSIVHRDLKLENFLVHQSTAIDGMGPVTTYKLCDFGSAVIGSIDISSNNAKRIASDIIEKTTSQLYRAPEMCDLYLKDELTEKTDVWALGCCLFSLAFCKDCFDENSNLAILSGKYKIPEDNQYGEGLEHLISRMLTIDYEDRADMPEVISCLSALYAKRPLPLRKVSQSQSPPINKSDSPRKGFFRTDGQGFKGNADQSPKLSKKVCSTSSYFSMEMNFSSLMMLGKDIESKQCCSAKKEKEVGRKCREGKGLWNARISYVFILKRFRKLFYSKRFLRKI